MWDEREKDEIGIACARSADATKLAEDRLLRLAYIDEAGVSNPQHEPFMVVAAAIVHGDKQWKPVAHALSQIIEENIPDGMREDFILHATELFSGGRTFRRDDAEWPKARRWGILERVLSIPKRYDVPIILVHAKRMQELPANLTRDDATNLEHTLAMLRCESQIEEWMRQNAEDEIIKITAEDHPRKKQFLSEFHKIFKDKQKLETLGLGESSLPFEHIIDAVSYEEKLESPLLQLADACASMFKRKLRGDSDADRLCDLFADQIFQSSIGFKDESADQIAQLGILWSGE